VIHNSNFDHFLFVKLTLRKRCFLYLWALFALWEHVFLGKICAANKWENFLLFSPLLFQCCLWSNILCSTSPPCCFLTTKNLFQITWCCFDDGECRNRCATFFFSTTRAFDYGRKRNCDVEDFVRHQMWLIVLDFSWE
jgi:hypothetical protein